LGAPFWARASTMTAPEQLLLTVQRIFSTIASGVNGTNFAA